MLFPGLKRGGGLLLGFRSVSESTRAITLETMTSEMSATFNLYLQP